MQIQVSPSFKKQTTKAIIAIIAFVLFYIILLCAAFAFTGACIAGGIAMIVAKPMFLTLALGIGLAGLGVMISIFLIKFIFSSHKTDLSNFIEIKRNQEPKLFAFLDEIVTITDTKFPKKVYISSEVNASVFYDSGFWSMFLPVKKNLHIGLGLVNSITHDELKAILSHEFGHFSQKSMKVGSYVYQVNQVIYNLLFDNESFSKLIISWANVSGYFSIFVSIGIKIIQGIQWLLGKMYAFVNKNYLALSREMEFHADEVAANVTGFLPLKTSLLRLDLANQSFSRVLGYYDTKVDEALTSKNLFKEHTFVMQFLAKKQNITIDNNLPQVSEKESTNFSNSKIVIKNQWASHPELEERIAALEKLEIIKSEINSSPANAIFENIENWQEQVTHKIFQAVSYAKEEIKNSLTNFETDFSETYEKESFDPIFNQYYDNHSPVTFSTEPLSESSKDLVSLFSDEKENWTKEALVLQNDLQILEAIANGTIDCNTFDYEGIKYSKKQVSTVKNLHQKHIEIIKNQLKENDQDIFDAFYRIAKDQHKEVAFVAVCQDFLKFDTKFDANLELCTKIYTFLQFTGETSTFEVIKHKFDTFKSIEESFQKELMAIATIMLEKEELNKDKFATIETYTSQSPIYFSNERYDEFNLQRLYQMLALFQQLNQRNYFLTKKNWIQFQADLWKN